MAKCTFTYDTINDAHEISINAHIPEVTQMIEGVKDYVHHLYNNEEREEIPVEEICNKLNDITDAWYFIEKIQ